MDRRTFVASTALTLAASSTPCIAAASAFATLVAALIEGGSQANEALDWLSWSQDATAAVSQGKAPPPSPHSPAIFQEKLDKARSRIAALESPAYTAALPKTGTVPTGGFDITRNAVRSRVSALQDCIAELAESRAARRNFKQLDARLDAQIAGLQRLSTALWEIASKVPQKLIFDTLAFQALDIENLIPTVAATRNILSSKLSALDATRKERLAVLQAAAAELKNVLLVEAIDLRNQVDRLQKLDAEVLVYQEKLVAQVAVRDKALERVNYREQLIDAAEMDVEETDARLTTAKNKLSSLANQINQWSAEANRAYVCPEKNVGWNECNNPDHVKYKNAYLEHRKQAEQRLQSLEGERDEAAELVNSTSNDLQDCRQRLKNAQTDLKLAKQEAVNAEAGVSTARQALAEKARIAQEEKWRSRADIFSAENTADQQYVAQAIGQLGADA